MSSGQSAAAPDRVAMVDPNHEYGWRFAQLLAARGQGIVAVLTPASTAADRRALRALPGLVATVEANGPLDALGRDLGRRLGVVGAIPFAEPVLSPTLDLLRGLGTGWNEPAVLSVLQDKSALKQVVRAARPDLGVGVARRVRLGEEPVDLGELPTRFVLKPNVGYGNRAVGYFDSTTDRAVLERFMRDSGRSEFVLEEYLDGPEYFINGQVDADGRVTSCAAFSYERIDVRGYPVDWLTLKVEHTAREYATLDAFAGAVVGALGLRRSPFHLEARLVDGVPRLVEIGTRLAGNGNAFICDRLHGDRLGIFEVAADHYLGRGGRELALDWKTYDAADVLYVHGVSEEAGIVHRIEGLEAVERHPMFLCWVKRPRLGSRLHVTRDLFSSPWCFVLRSAAGVDALRDAAAGLRAELRINRPGAPLRRASREAASLSRRVALRMARLVGGA